jgi:hypothetical protein
VPEEDRAPLREILAELLGRGVLVGDEGSGRDLYLLARDHYRSHLEDYLAPLALELIVHEDSFLLQARPRPEACLLLGTFTKDETLLLLALWRLYDDERSSSLQQTAVVTVDRLWAALRVYFDKLDPPQPSQLESMLARMRRHRLIRTTKPEGMSQLGEMEIEILPSLAHAIPFEDLADWQARAELYKPRAGGDEPDSPGDVLAPSTASRGEAHSEPEEANLA